MECFLLYLDNLDDWVYAVALVGEKLRRLLRNLALVACAALAQVALILLAIRHPAIGAAMAACLPLLPCTGQQRPRQSRCSGSLIPFRLAGIDGHGRHPP